MNYYSMGTKKKRKCFLNSVPLQFQPAQENQEMLTEKMLKKVFQNCPSIALIKSNNNLQH